MVRNIIFSLTKILIVLILLLTLAMNNTYVHAFSLGDIFQIGDEFIETGKNPHPNNKVNTIDMGEVKNLSDIIYNTLLGIGVTLSVVVGAILGIKFMISSVDEKAQIKEALIPYVAGCVVVFGAFGIWKLVIVIGSSF